MVAHGSIVGNTNESALLHNHCPMCFGWPSMFRPPIFVMISPSFGITALLVSAFWLLSCRGFASFGLAAPDLTAFGFRWLFCFLLVDVVGLSGLVDDLSDAIDLFNDLSDVVDLFNDLSDVVDLFSDFSDADDLLNDLSDVVDLSSDLSDAVDLSNDLSAAVA